ncbi:MAG TPA: bifunctional diaminohydroxyphosphoribosylaminopyrimidine deaminase/5-amino-6-(5-phosphoribosylamino)uracil reductase RibD [Planctomycetota bacterium]|jgi:diaminohydroxyphosphoribosylaminopyrimidine deaminase/5-amino-6-(5-phosphoribosylamino)uracil reductase
MPTHAEFIEQALTLAEQGRGWVSPNPMVGALVVHDGQIAGRGWHQQFGGPHAEVFALQDAGPRARGATLYCTLEPCDHTGKTPPCVNAVIKAGIKTVVLGARDPNPVAAGGIATLREAGIDVITGVGEDACKLLNAAFFKVVSRRLPLVSLKWAMSADGKIATATGDSKWISNEASREIGHRLRAEHDAILVGIRTLLADGSRLTCRKKNMGPGGTGNLAEQEAAPPACPCHTVRQPRRVILDSSARTPLDAPLWEEADGGPVIVFAASTADSERVSALQARGAEVILLRPTARGLPLRGVLEALVQRGVLSVLVEGGSAVLGSFVGENLADRAYIFVAPKIIGGSEAPGPVGGEGAEKISAAQSLSNVSVQTQGGDVLLSGRLGTWDWL